MTLSNGDFVSEKQPDLSHLTLSTREVAMLPDEQRITYVRGDRWIGYTRAGASFAAAGRIVCMAE
jgi:hypothetical protein